MTPYILATALICAAGGDPKDCTINTAEDVLHAPVPKQFCQPAMQQLVAEHEPPNRLAGMVVKIVCDPNKTVAGLTASDVGVIAEPHYRRLAPPK
jgi:hypothetical protein